MIYFITHWFLLGVVVFLVTAFPLSVLLRLQIEPNFKYLNIFTHAVRVVADILISFFAYRFSLKFIHQLKAEFDAQSEAQT